MTGPGNSGAPRTLAAYALAFWRVWAWIAFWGLGFFLPFSTAGVAIALSLMVALALTRPQLVWRERPWKDPVMATGLVLFAYIAVHTLWISGNTLGARELINHYQELVLAPMVLALMANGPYRRLFIRSLMAGATLLALLYWIDPALPSLSRALTTRRISAGFSLAICAYLALVLAQRQRSPWPMRGLSAFLALTVLFALDGRTGYVVLLALACYAGWLFSPRRWRWLAIVAAPVLIAVLAATSNTVAHRLKETLAASQTLPVGTTLTSTEIRANMLRLAGDLAQRYAWSGAGFVEYPVVNEQAARKRFGDDLSRIDDSSGWLRTTNPHNEYLMQLVGGGVVALGLFLAWLALALRAAARAPSRTGPILTGAVLAFATGCLFNSLLLDFVEGHFYMCLLAWLLAEVRHGQEGRSTAEVRSVLVVATRQIGDVLLATPLIHAARAQWPAARIEVLGFEGTLGMLAGNADVDELIQIPARPRWGGIRLLRRLRRRYDLALITDPGDRAHLMGWLAAAARSGIVPEHGASNWWKKALLDHAVVSAGDLGETHVVSEKLALLAPWMDAAPQEAAGLEPLQRVVPPRAAPLPEAIDALVRPGCVVVHAPSMWSYKQWPLAHYRDLVKSLRDMHLQVVLTGSGGVRDQECIAALRDLDAAPWLLDVSGRLDFQQLATLLQRASLYVGPDTSVSHLAGAVGTPVVAIFGPTNPMRWAPWPARTEAKIEFRRSAGAQQVGNVTIVQGGLACVPCGRAGCEDHRQSRSDCLDDITPEQVMEQVRRVLAGN
jgi:ADP-heptose:LPS heptosyltransferase/O-antigen ligase